MRLLHLRAGNLYGGVETTMVEQARHQSLFPELDLHFAVCFSGRLKDELADSGVPLDTLGDVRLRNPGSVFRVRRQLRHLLRRRRFDVVIVHSPWEQVIFAPVVRAAGLPMVFWLHDATTGRHWLERWARRYPPQFALCNSHFTKSHLPNLYRGVRAEVLYNPLVSTKPSYSADELAAMRGECDTARDAVVIIQFGRMEEWKGHSLHLRALSMLRDLPDWVCWQVGGAQRPHEARYLEKLKYQVGEYGLTGRVHFLGQRSDIPKLLAAADVHCQPNTGPEPFGNVFIEALFAGLPVVATRIGGAVEIIDLTCGMLVQKGDAEALAASLRRLIQDASLRRMLGSAGPARARALCDVVTQTKHLGKMLSSVLHQGVAA